MLLVVRPRSSAPAASAPLLRRAVLWTVLCFGCGCGKGSDDLPAPYVLAAEAAAPRTGFASHRRPAAIRPAGPSAPPLAGTKPPAGPPPTRRARTALTMGMFDFVFGRRADFARVDPTEAKAFGPPVVLLWNYAAELDDGTISAYVEENAPKTLAAASGADAGTTIVVRRLNWDRREEEEGGAYGKTVGSYLKAVWEEGTRAFPFVGEGGGGLAYVYGGPVKSDMETATAERRTAETGRVDVTIDVVSAHGSGPEKGMLYRTNSLVYVSGIHPSEMVSVGRALQYLHNEATEGNASAALALAVPNAMDKGLGRIFEEISGDHAEAMAQ